MSKEAAIGLLMDLLSIPSVNGRDDEGAVAIFLREYFDAHGVFAQLQKIDDSHANVFAFIPGRDKNRTMLWNGHLDTVPYGDLRSWHTDPAVPLILDGRVYGRGASDMKSGLAAMTFALSHLQQRGITPAHNILFLGTCDEEKNGAGAEAALKQIRDRNFCFPGFEKQCFPDIADQERPFLLVGEPTDLRPGTAHKGCLWLQLQVQGRTSHGAYPEKGINAITCGMHVAKAISAYVSSFSHPLLGSATAQITRIEGGIANNMTPDTCRIVMDIRMVPGVCTDQVLIKGQEALQKEAEIHPGLSISFECLNNRRAIEINPAHPQVAKLRSLLQNADRDAAPIGINFFTDASILDREDGMDICLFGPGDPALAHQPDEYVEIDKYLDAISILEAFCSGDL